MRVRCERILAVGEPGHRKPLPDGRDLRVGGEYTVLAVAATPRLDDVLPVSLLVLGDDASVAWWPSEMFRTISTRIPSNWVAQVGPDGTVRLAAEAWQQRGFWERYYASGRNEANDEFDRELEVILREA
jgi:hypothetical protein